MRVLLSTFNFEALKKFDESSIKSSINNKIYNCEENKIYLNVKKIWITFYYTSTSGMHIVQNANYGNRATVWVVAVVDTNDLSFLNRRFSTIL